MDRITELAGRVPRLSRPVLVAVDGVDGAGKTTFAAALAAALRTGGRVVHVVHCDDFHHPRAVRYRRGRESPLGFFCDTYDLDALADKVLDPLAEGGDRVITPRVFDWPSDTVVAAAPVAVGVEDVVIVEGLFLHRDELWRRWDLSVFLEVPFAVSIKRMSDRDGTHPDPAHPSVRRYVEGQEIYFRRCRPRQRADVVVDN